MGPPQCLMEEMGDAPVPPSWPLIWMMSAFALATPLATVPMPACATSFTDTFASGATCAAGGPLKPGTLSAPQDQTPELCMHSTSPRCRRDADAAPGQLVTTADGSNWASVMLRVYKRATQ